MDHVVLAIRDCKVGEYLSGFFVERSVPSGLRSVALQLEGSGGLVEKYAEDFEVHQIGVINLENGRWVSTVESGVIPLGTVESIIRENGNGRHERA